MLNLFYDCLPYEIQHKILILSSVSQIKEKKNSQSYNITDPCFIYIFEKTHGRKIPKNLTRKLLRMSNNNLYWYFMISGIDHLQKMSNSILFMKYMKHKTLIDMCITNGLTIKKNWSKQRLISLLIKI